MMRRVSLTTSAGLYETWTEIEIIRNLHEISGSFRLVLDDTARAEQAGLGGALSIAGAVTMGDPCTIAIDGEPVLVGYIDEVSPEIESRSARVMVQGRDVTGDLVDCACNPEGPYEYRKITLDALIKALVKPFGIGVKVECDLGKPFDLCSIDVGEPVMSVITKYAMKRTVLVVSDGIGNLVLTQSGQEAAPGELRFGENVLTGRAEFSMRNRFSHYYVLGQASEAGGTRADAAPLDSSVDPPTQSPTQSPDYPREPDADAPTGREQKALTRRGLSKDQAVKRYRPTLVRERAKSGSLDDMKSAAEWGMKTARGASEQLEYTVPDFRVNGALWRTNELVNVFDPYLDVADQYLIAGVAFRAGSQGSTTTLRLIGPEAFMMYDGESDASTSEDPPPEDNTAYPLDASAPVA